ncbi:MAG: hypothetical protein AMXMBFR44_5030 [Candidatus Campbellbacteria bacterium]
MDYTLRKAREQDIPQIIELSGLLADHHHVLDSYWKAGSETKNTFGEFIKSELEKTNVMLLVAEVNQKVVGYFSAEISPTKPVIFVPYIGHISNGFLLEEYRGKGIAKKAVEQFLSWFKKQNVKVAELTVDSRNVEGVRAWEGMGFKEYMKRMKMDI